MAGYLPTADAALDTFLQGFSGYCESHFAELGMTNADADQMATAAEEYHDALVTATTPATRTKATVAAKDALKANASALARFWIQLIKKNKGISNAVKTAAGIPLDDTTRTPIPAPTTQPLLEIIGATALHHTLRFADASTPDKRGKPPGAELLMLFRYVGATPPADPAGYAYVLATGRQPVEVAQNPADVGKMAWYVGCWATARGLAGPFSNPVSMIIA